MNFNNKFGKRRAIGRSRARLIGLLSLLGTIFIESSVYGMDNKFKGLTKKSSQRGADFSTSDYNGENFADRSEADESFEDDYLDDVEPFGLDDNFGKYSAGKQRGAGRLRLTETINKPLYGSDMFSSGAILKKLPTAERVLKKHSDGPVDISLFTKPCTYFRNEEGRKISISIGRDSRGYIHLFAHSTRPEHVKTALSKLIIHESTLKNYIILMNECCGPDNSAQEMLINFIEEAVEELPDIRLNRSNVDSCSWDYNVSRKVYDFLSKNLPKEEGEIRKETVNIQNSPVSGTRMRESCFDSAKNVKGGYNNYLPEISALNKSPRLKTGEEFDPVSINIKLKKEINSNTKTRRSYDVEVKLGNDVVDAMLSDSKTAGAHGKKFKLMRLNIDLDTKLNTDETSVNVYKGRVDLIDENEVGDEPGILGYDKLKGIRTNKKTNPKNKISKLNNNLKSKKNYEDDMNLMPDEDSTEESYSFGKSNKFKLDKKKNNVNLLNNSRVPAQKKRGFADYLDAEENDVNAEDKQNITPSSRKAGKDLGGMPVDKNRSKFGNSKLDNKQLYDDEEDYEVNKDSLQDDSLGDDDISEYNVETY